MSKQKSRFVCQSCGAISPRWSGKCDGCGSWNSFVEELIPNEKKGRGARSHQIEGRAYAITSIDTEYDERIKTGIKEFDRVLGGGIVPGSVVLIGGDPGIGKSTLMMQIFRDDIKGSNLAGKKILYVTGEESLKQIKLRADRLHVSSDNFLVYAETNIDAILNTLTGIAPDLVIIDSIQTVYRPELESAPGSISQVRESTALLLQRAKAENIPMFIIGHVTKDGAIAGPRVLEHMVDTVLQFEGDQHHAYRIIRGLKNRFGSTNEIGIFEMREDGLREVTNPSEVFLSERMRGVTGSCVTASMEGTRALLIEVQALVTPSNYGMPQRTATGFDKNRLQLLLAVLEKRYGIRFGQFDVFVNVAGGVRIDEPAADLAVTLAIASSVNDKAVDYSTVVFGEIGLGGEVRTVSHVEKRVHESAKLGFNKIILPKGNARELHKSELKIFEAEKIPDAMSEALK